MAVNALPCVERLVISGRSEEKRVHVRHTACLPRVQILIENGHFPEHALRVADSANAPKSDCLIKRAPSEHVPHRCDFANVPRVERLVEDGRIFERRLRRATARARRETDYLALVCERAGSPTSPASMSPYRLVALVPACE